MTYAQYLRAKRALSHALKYLTHDYGARVVLYHCQANLKNECRYGFGLKRNVDHWCKECPEYQFEGDIRPHPAGAVAL
jgi:hypothetical protein